MGISKKNRVFGANISEECIIGLDTMKMFKMVLDVGKAMGGVIGKVLPGWFKYVGGWGYRFTRWKRFVEWSWGRR